MTIEKETSTRKPLLGAIDAGAVVTTTTFVDLGQVLYR